MICAAARGCGTLGLFAHRGPLCYFDSSDHALDVDRRELRRRSELIAVEPQVFDLLVYLIRNRDRVVSKDDLMEGVWGGGSSPSRR